MKRFSDIAKRIKTHPTKLTGKKITVNEILNKEIVIHHYRIEKSKIKNNTHCVWIQIEYNGEKRAIFTASYGLTYMLQQMEAGDFPTIATIVKDNKWYQLK